MSRILGRASQYPVAPITANTADLDLLEMNDYDEENIIKLARDRFPSGVSIKQHLIQRYKARFPGTHLAFKLWHELAGSPCGISKRFWQIIRDQQGEIPITYSRIYFVNVALPDGQLASKLYTVVTVSLNKQEKPLALDLPPSGTVLCCGEACKDIYQHLDRYCSRRSWTVESIRPLGAKSNDYSLTTRCFNDDSLAPNENTLIVFVSPASSPNTV
ncbi:hypothetical protein PIIN_09892 [Serendipita indica DSM 11827]|uniref:Uncharacterized protein n=1 Tax=Serendipita indica (strain DSM 11827) TaxID=1109443 RepID=G4TX53_SERID|nr:hypothetical protein PIIN_09892 [Serendipita indica DSM 11827]